MQNFTNITEISDSLDIADWNRKQSGIYGAVALLQKTPRFVFDGVSRIPNFLNDISEAEKRLQEELTHEAQGSERPIGVRDSSGPVLDPHAAEDIDVHSSKAPVAPLEPVVSKAPEPMAGHNIPRMAKIRSYVSHDPRFNNLSDPFVRASPFPSGFNERESAESASNGLRSSDAKLNYQSSSSRTALASSPPPLNSSLSSPPPPSSSSDSSSATTSSMDANDFGWGTMRGGPGCYPSVETRALPSIGLLPFDHALAGADVTHDPLRHSMPFLARERPGSALWERPPAGPGVLLLAKEDPNWKPGPSKWAPWHMSGDVREETVNWRYSSLLNIREEKRGLEGSYEVADVGSSPIDRSGAAVEVWKRSQEKNLTCTAFDPRQPRFVLLPADRSNDTRVRTLTHQMSPADPSWRPAPHPHRHIPLQSLGSAKKRTYRLFDIPPNTATVGRGTTVVPPEEPPFPAAAKMFLRRGEGQARRRRMGGGDREQGGMDEWGEGDQRRSVGQHVEGMNPKARLSYYGGELRNTEKKEEDNGGRSLDNSVNNNYYNNYNNRMRGGDGESFNIFGDGCNGNRKKHKLKVLTGQLNLYYPPASAAASAAMGTAKSTFAMGGGGGGAGGRNMLVGSQGRATTASNFSSISRVGDKYGPFTWSTDSRLVKH